MAVVLVVGLDDGPTQRIAEKLTGQSVDASGAWHIATKYYDVEVDVKTATLRDDAKTSLADAACEALILVADWDLESSFVRLKEWYENCRRPKSVAPISLLVLNKSSGEKEHASWMDKGIEWSIENGFELIQISIDVEIDAELEAEGHGIKRLKEALEAHMWPGCTLKDSKKQKSTERPRQIPNEDVTDQPVKPDEDDPCDEFEKLMLEMSNARERLQRLPDKERREGAADMAMKLARFFVDD